MKNTKTSTFIYILLIFSAILGFYEWVIGESLGDNNPTHRAIKSSLLAVVLAIGSFSANIFSAIVWGRPDRSWIKGRKITLRQSVIIIELDINEKMTMNFLNVTAYAKVKTSDDSWSDPKNISCPLNVMHNADLKIMIHLPENFTMNDIVQLYLEAKSDHNGNTYLWTDSFQIKDEIVKR